MNINNSNNDNLINSRLEFKKIKGEKYKYKVDSKLEPEKATLIGRNTLSPLRYITEAFRSLFDNQKYVKVVGSDNEEYYVKTTKVAKIIYPNLNLDDDLLKSVRKKSSQELTSKLNQILIPDEPKNINAQITLEEFKDIKLTPEQKKAFAKSLLEECQKINQNKGNLNTYEISGVEKQNTNEGIIYKAVIQRRNLLMGNKQPQLFNIGKELAPLFGVEVGKDLRGAPMAPVLFPNDVNSPKHLIYDMMSNGNIGECLETIETIDWTK